jgi:anti-sigma factor RsiW
MPQCPQENLVSAYLDGELQGQDRARFQEHLASCPQCRALVAQMMDIEEQLRSGIRAIDVQSSSDIASSVQQALSRTGAFRRVRRRRWWQHNSGSLAAFLARLGILVAVLAVTIWAANRFTRVSPPEQPTGVVADEPRLVPPRSPTPDAVLASAEALLSDLVRSARTEPGAARRLREKASLSGTSVRLTCLAESAIDRSRRASLVHLCRMIDDVASLENDAQAVALATRVENAKAVDAVRQLRHQLRQEGL